MNLIQYITKKNIIRLILPIIVISILFICYDNLIFRLKSTSPDINKVATSSISIRYHFSQPIKTIDQVLLDGVVISNAVTEGRVLTIPFSSTMKENETHSISIKGIYSKWFNNKIDAINSSFSPAYIDFNRLSKEEQQAQINASNSGQVDDPFIAKHVFPIFNEHWQIDSTTIQDTRTAVLNIKFFDEVPNYDNGGKITRVSNETAEEYRLEVLNKIKELDGKPDNYEIIYDNPYLYSKYNTRHTHD